MSGRANPEPVRPKIVMISYDRKIFEEGSASRARFAAYGQVAEEVHIIVYARASLGLHEEQIAPNVWAYPTNSASRVRYIADGLRIVQERIARNSVLPISIVSAQDPCDTGILGWLIAHKYKSALQLQDHIDVFNPWFMREHPLNVLRALVAYFLLPQADGVRAVSAKSASRLIRVCRNTRSRVDIVPVYVDLRRCHEAKPSLLLQERYPNFEQFMLMATRFVPQKNIALALEAFAIIVKERPKTALILVGEGPERAALENRVRKLRLSDKVMFVPWQHDLIPYYKSADVFLLTSYYESYGRTPLEAAACGLPFVSSDVGISAALIAEGAAGRVCTSRDPSEFSEAVADLLKRPPEDNQRSFAAATKLNSASLDAYLERYESLIENCMARHRSKRLA